MLFNGRALIFTFSGAQVRIAEHECLQYYDPNKRTMACILMQAKYFVVVALPSRHIKRVVKLTACNYERCVYLWRYFPDEKYGSVDYKRYHLIKIIKKERLERFNRFTDQNTRRDSLYRYIILSFSSWVGAPFNLQNLISFYAKVVHNWWNDWQLSLRRCFFQCFSVTTAFSFGALIMSYHEQTGVGINWSNVQDTDIYNLSFAWCMYMMLIDSAAYLAIAWYIRNVFQGQSSGSTSACSHYDHILCWHRSNQMYYHSDSQTGSFWRHKNCWLRLEW